MTEKKGFNTTIIVGIIMAVIAVIWFVPIYYMGINTFKPLKEVLFDTAGFPDSFFLENIVKVWEQTDYLVLFRNSFIVTSISLAGIVLLASMTGYRLARIRSRSSSFLILYFILTLIIPFQAIMIPLVKTLRDFFLIDSLWGLIIVYLSIGAPMPIYLYYGFTKTIPGSLEEAARIDGASPLKTFFAIIFPLLSPMTSTIIILQSLWIWNDFLLPLITLHSDKFRTIPVGVTSTFFGQYAFKWNLGITAMLLASLPMLILYIFMQKYIIQGITKGAVKG